MNILFLSISTAVSKIDNRGIYPDLLRKFASEGHNVYIVCPAERRHKVETNLTVNGNVNILRVRTLNITKTNIVEKVLSTLLISYLYDLAVSKFFKDFSFGLILYSTPPITFNGLIGKLKKSHQAKTYLLLKDIFPQNAVDLGMMSKKNPGYWFFRRKEKKLYNISDFIGCMSPANVDFLLEHNRFINRLKTEVCPNSIEVIPGSETVNRAKVLGRYNIPVDAVVFSFGGNLGEPQGIDFLIEVLKSNVNNQKIFFLISGDGTAYNKIDQWIRFELPANVRLLKSLPKEEYENLLGACDAGLIFLNRKFTIPNYPSRLLSYMEKKLPVLFATDVHTDIGSIAENNHYGFRVESGNLNAFNNKLNQLANDELLRKEMGKNGYQYLLKEYTVDVSYRIIMNHFV